MNSEFEQVGEKVRMNHNESVVTNRGEWRVEEGMASRSVIK